MLTEEEDLEKCDIQRGTMAQDPIQLYTRLGVSESTTARSVSIRSILSK